MAEEEFVTEDALSAIIKILIDPLLARLNPYAEAAVGEDDISKQMEAIAWLYNHFLCRDFPHLEFLHASVLWRKTILLRPRLIRYMGQTKGGRDAFVTMTLTERKVTDACNVSKALRNPMDSKVDLVSNVCVCLLDNKLERCVLVLGSATIGVWSFIEKAANPLAFDIEQQSKRKCRKKKKNVKEAADERLQMVTFPHPREIAFTAVKEQTGIETDLLRVEHELTIHHESTHFFIMSCKDDVNLTPTVQLERVVWVPTNEALSQAEGPLLAKTTMGLYATSAVQHFRLRPFCSTLRNWFSRQGSEILKSECGRNSSANEPARIAEIPLSTVKFSSQKDFAVVPPPISLNELDDALHTLEVNSHGLEGGLSRTTANRKSDSSDFHKAAAAALEHTSIESDLQDVGADMVTAANISDFPVKKVLDSDQTVKARSEHSTKEKPEMSVLQTDNGMIVIEQPTANLPEDSVQLKDSLTGDTQLQSNKLNLRKTAASVASGKQGDSSMSSPSRTKDHNDSIQIARWSSLAKELKMVTGEPRKKLSFLHHDHDMITKESATDILQQKEIVKGNTLPRREIQHQAENEKLQNSGTAVIVGLEEAATNHLPCVGECLSLVVSEMRDAFEDIHSNQIGKPRQLVAEKHVPDAAILQNGHILTSNILEPKNILAEGNILRKHTKEVTECISKSQAESISEPPASARQFESFVDSKMHSTSLQTVQEKRDAYMKELTELIAKYQLHANRLIKQIKFCDEKILKHLGAGSEDTQQLAMNICNDKNVRKRKQLNRDKVLQEGSSAQPCELSPCETDISITHVQKKLVSRDDICKTLDSTKELRDICIKNLWPLPSYSIFAVSSTKSESSYYGKARLRGTDFDLSETGELCKTMKQARASAAAYMLGTLYSIRARNGIA